MRVLPVAAVSPGRCCDGPAREELGPRLAPWWTPRRLGHPPVSGRSGKRRRGLGRRGGRRAGGSARPVPGAAARLLPLRPAGGALLAPARPGLYPPSARRRPGSQMRPRGKCERWRLRHAPDASYITSVRRAAAHGDEKRFGVHPPRLPRWQPGAHPPSRGRARLQGLFHGEFQCV